MTTILQIEYRPSLLSTREEVLESLGHPILSVLGSEAARVLDLGKREIGVIVIGHGAPWCERSDLVGYFKRVLPLIPLVALLRLTDDPIGGADYNCAADNPPEWIRSVTSALGGMA